MNESPSALKPSAHRVQEALISAGVECSVVELPQTTRTASEAADAIGCNVAEIAKSIVFVKKASKRPILVIASGANRIEESLIERYIDETIEKASAAQVREATGYAIGGVPPLGHVNQVDVLLDEDLFNLDVLWAAAGTPNSVFCITPEQLREVTNGKTIRVKKQ